jgi:hypothetical protein
MYYEYYEIEFESQIAAQKRAVGDQIGPGCASAAKHSPQSSKFSVVRTARTLSMLGYGSPCPLYQSRVTSHVILIETPRLEFPATLTKQRLRFTSNLDKMALFSAGLTAPARKQRQPSPPKFLIANLELEFLLNIEKSIKYKFLIANKRSFCVPLRRNRALMRRNLFLHAGI